MRAKPDSLAEHEVRWGEGSGSRHGFSLCSEEQKELKKKKKNEEVKIRNCNIFFKELVCNLFNY